MKGERDYSPKEAESQIEVYGAELDAIAEMLTSVHPIGRVMGIGRRQCATALAEVLDAATGVRNEVASVLLLMDELASVWGDEGVFRRCRDRLRVLVTEESPDATT